MKDDSLDLDIEVCGRRYTVEKTASGQPAIYHSAFYILSFGHAYQKAGPYAVSYPIPSGCILIVARPLLQDDPETEISND